MPWMEAKLRTMFATCALLSLAAVFQLLQFGGHGGQSRLLVALLAGLCISGLEALGLFRLAARTHWRVFGALLLGTAALYTLESCF